MFPFKNAVMMQFNTELDFHSQDFQDALEAHRIEHITDDEPKSQSYGFAPILIDCDDLLLSTTNNLHLLKLVFETRKLNTSVLNKKLNKQQQALEANGDKLDDEQINKLTHEISKLLLADTPTTTDCVYIAFDFETGLAMFSTTSIGTLKAVRAELYQLADFHFSVYSPMNEKPYLLNDWAKQGDIGFGLYPGGNIKAKFDTCTLTLKNADLGSNVISEVLQSFDVTELQFIGQRINALGDVSEFLTAAITDKGELKQMDWSLHEHFDEHEPDSINAAIVEEFRLHGLLWRQLMAGLYLSAGLFEDKNYWPTWLQTASTSFVQAHASVDDVDHVLLRDAMLFVIRSRSASISALQREFNITYPLAARIVEELERQHIVSAVNENGVRQVLRHQLDSEVQDGEG